MVRWRLAVGIHEALRGKTPGDHGGHGKKKKRLFSGTGARARAKTNWFPRKRRRPMGRRGPKPLSPELRALKGYGPRLPVDRPATAFDPARLDEWLASDDCPLGWLAKHDD